MGLLNRKSVERQAHDLADRMPELLIEAGRVAHTVTYGIHGRRRKGAGDTFWQFRHFEQSDAPTQIDWRRSGTSDHLFVRENEWESAHTVWLWPAAHEGMNFASHLAPIFKLDRALVLTLALSELLVRAGERVGIPGVMRPTSARTAPQKLAHRLLENADRMTKDFPVFDHLGRFSELVIVSDFLAPIDELGAGMDKIASAGVRGHLLQVLDPAEESLPYRGRILFEHMQSGDGFLAGKVETLQEAYQTRIKAHREALSARATQLNWSFMAHHTDRPAQEALLALYARLSGNGGVR